MITNKYPEPFVTGLINYPETRDGKLSAIADALTAWGNASSGIELSENFGVAMAKISVFLGQSATPENLMRLADSLL